MSRRNRTMSSLKPGNKQYFPLFVDETAMFIIAQPDANFNGKIGSGPFPCLQTSILCFLFETFFPYPISVCYTPMETLKPEASMTELRKITEENFLDAFHLRLAPGQESFVSHPIRSLAQAYVCRDKCQAFGIYAEGKISS